MCGVLSQAWRHIFYNPLKTFYTKNLVLERLFPDTWAKWHRNQPLNNC